MWKITANDQHVHLTHEITEGTPDQLVQLNRAEAAEVAIQILYLLLAQPTGRELVQASSYYAEVRRALTS